MYWVEWNTRNARPARKSREESSPRGEGGLCQRGGAVLGLMLEGEGGIWWSSGRGLCHSYGVEQWEGIVIAMGWSSGRGLS